MWYLDSRTAGNFEANYVEFATKKKQLARSVGALPRATLKDIIQRVVKAAQPDRIVLFGSAARGKMGPNSDVDLLVIKSGKFDRGRLTTAIYRQLYGVDAAVDVVVVTPEDVAQYRNQPCLVIAPALNEGRTVYGA